MLSTAQQTSLTHIFQEQHHTLPAVAQQMATISEWLQESAEYKNLLPFHLTYHLLLKRIAATSLENPHFFANWQAVEKEEVTTAHLYLNALSQYFLENKKTLPWQTYLRYCEQPHSLPFVQLLLGLNAYLNATIVTALKKTAFQEKKDFLHLSDLLLFELPVVMKYIAFAEDSFAMEGIISLKKFMVENLPAILVEWHLQAWEKYQKDLPDHLIYQQAETTAHTIIHLFEHEITGKSLKEMIKEVGNLKV